MLAQRRQRTHDTRRTRRAKEEHPLPRGPVMLFRQPTWQQRRHHPLLRYLLREPGVVSGRQLLKWIPPRWVVMFGLLLLVFSLPLGLETMGAVWLTTGVLVVAGGPALVAGAAAYLAASQSATTHYQMVTLTLLDDAELARSTLYATLWKLRGAVWMVLGTVLFFAGGAASLSVVINDPPLTILLTIVAVLEMALAVGLCWLAAALAVALGFRWRAGLWLSVALPVILFLAMVLSQTGLFLLIERAWIGHELCQDCAPTVALARVDLGWMALLSLWPYPLGWLAEAGARRWARFSAN